MLNVFSTIGNFFGTIFSNWQGFLIGLVLAVIAIITLSLTLLKNSDYALKIVGTTLFIIFGFGGAFIQSLIFRTDNSKLPTINEIITNVNVSLNSGYKNTNGFTIKQVNDAQNDESCPTAPDEIIEFTIRDFSDYVCVSYDVPVLGIRGLHHENITFLKSSNGLILDGFLNAGLSYPSTNKGFLSWKIDFSHPKWEISNKTPIYERYAKRYVGFIKYFPWDNLVSVSTPLASFLSREYTIFEDGWNDVHYHALMDASSYLGNYVAEKHISWSDGIELTGTLDDIYFDVNTFYTYLFNAMKNEEYGATKLVDSAGYICKTIPVEERKNYPVSAEFKAENPDIDYYSVYRCNLGVKLTYLKGNTNLSSDNDRQKEYVEKNKDNVGETDTPPNIYSLTCKFKDISTEEYVIPDLSLSPIQIIFTNGELTHTLTISSFDALLNSTKILLKSKGTWRYTILSDRVIFSQPNGTFTLINDNSSVTFDFEYRNDFIPFTASLNPVTSVDLSSLDLSETPVKVILLNADNQYTFTFDSFEKLTNGITQDVKFGTYNYTIVSEALQFNPLNGTLDVTATNTSYIFNYSYDPLTNLTLNLTVTTLSGGSDVLRVSEASINAIKNVMTIPNEFKFVIEAYSFTNVLISSSEYFYGGETEVNKILPIFGFEFDVSYMFLIKVVDLNNENVVYVSNVDNGSVSKFDCFNFNLEVIEN